MVGHSRGGLVTCRAAGPRRDLALGIYLEDVTPLFLTNPNTARPALLDGVLSIGRLVEQARDRAEPLAWLEVQMSRFAHDDDGTVGDRLTNAAIRG